MWAAALWHAEGNARDGRKLMAMMLAVVERQQAAQGHQVQTKFQEVFFWVKLKAVPPVKFENNQVKEAIKVDVLVKAHQLGAFETLSLQTSCCQHPSASTATAEAESETCAASSDATCSASGTADNAARTSTSEGRLAVHIQQVD